MSLTKYLFLKSSVCALEGGCGVLAALKFMEHFIFGFLAHSDWHSLYFVTFEGCLQQNYNFWKSQGRRCRSLASFSDDGVWSRRDFDGQVYGGC